MVDGRGSTGLRFRHADGSSYGGTLSATMVSAHAEAFRALRNLGFRESEAKSALEHVRAAHVGVVGTGEVIRAALSALA
jgi:Holliday junction resolvasome RuvABC DNA-binding subunit